MPTPRHSLGRRWRFRRETTTRAARGDREQITSACERGTALRHRSGSWLTDSRLHGLHALQERYVTAGASAVLLRSVAVQWGRSLVSSWPSSLPQGQMSQRCRRSIFGFGRSAEWHGGTTRTVLIRGATPTPWPLQAARTRRRHRALGSSVAPAPAIGAAIISPAAGSCRVAEAALRRSRHRPARGCRHAARKRPDVDPVRPDVRRWGDPAVVRENWLQVHRAGLTHSTACDHLLPAAPQTSAETQPTVRGPSPQPTAACTRLTPASLSSSRQPWGL